MGSTTSTPQIAQARSADGLPPASQVTFFECFISTIIAQIFNAFVASLIILLVWSFGVGANIQKATTSNPYLNLSPEKVVEQGRSLDRRLAESSSPKAKPTKDIALVGKNEIEQTRIALQSGD
jgi:hypothetical protein